MRHLPIVTAFAVSLAACLPPPPPDSPGEAGGEMACTGGAVPYGGQCVCPAGSQWDGAQCVGQAAPQQQVYEQRTIQRSQDFTCCINHAQYKCRDDASFRACSTLQPHGCAPAGRC